MAYTKNYYRRALRKVRTKLLNGKITKEQFDMDVVLEVGECGTIACIGGHMAMEMNPATLIDSVGSGMASGLMTLAARKQSNLDALFYGYPRQRFGVRPITRRSAAAAITRALDGAENPWKPLRR